MLRRLGPAAGLRLGPQVPEAAPSSGPTWPRACTVEAEPARARRVRGWRDEAVERLRGGGQNEIIPARAQPASERHPTQRRPSAITARPQVRRAADICARSGGGSERHGRRGARDSTLGVCDWNEAWRSVAPHLPMGFTVTSKGGSDSSKVERRFWFLQASARACLSSRHAWARGPEPVACPVEDRAGHGGAHGRGWVRARAQTRAWQGLRRRLSSPPHAATIVLNEKLSGRQTK